MMSDFQNVTQFLSEDDNIRIISDDFKRNVRVQEFEKNKCKLKY